MFASAQNILIKGSVLDSSTGKALPYATLSLVTAHDSMLIGFTVADSTGRFRLKNIPRDQADHGSKDEAAYLLSVSYTGYSPVWKALADLPATGTYDAGVIPLSVRDQLETASVTARRPPVQINNDTLEFNAENFKTQPNAVVEDMLKKMPGVTVESDGSIKVNGQTVRRIMVNGKDFFTGDPKMATKNLNADAVDKVQVFDRKSDQSAFTGIDDGNSEKTINLKLKKDHNNALFGKVTAGAGSDGRYDAQANINKFDGDEQVSLLGMGNNTNRQGFSMMDVLNFTGQLAKGMRNGGGGVQIQMGDAGSNNGLPVTGLGQSQQGVATTLAGGLNYNNTWKNSGTDLNANYTRSDIRLLTDKQSFIQNLSTGNPYNTLDTMHTVQDITQQRLGLILDQQIDSSLSFRLTPSLTWQHSNKGQQEEYASSTLAGEMLNNGFSNTGTTPGAFNFTTDFLVRQRFRKKGRTLSGDFSMTYNHSTLGGSQVSDNNFYNAGASPVDSNINLVYQRDAITRSLGGNLTYTEPIGRRSLLALTGFYNSNTGSSDKQSYDYDPGSAKYIIYDSLLSNDFSSDYRYAGGGLSFRSNQRKINITAGATLQAANLKAVNLSDGSAIRQSFTDILPNAILQYSPAQSKNLRLDYNTYTTQPTVAQLQPVADLSDPLNVSFGNPQLKRTYNHNWTLTYLSGNPGMGSSILAMLNFSAAVNAIVQSDSLTPYGTKLTHPVNADGVQNLLGNLEYSFPIRPWKGRIEVGGHFNYSKNISFVNSQRNNISSFTYRPFVAYSFNEGDKMDVELKASVSLNAGRYSLQPELNTNYWRQNYGVIMTNYLPVGLSLHNEFSYILNTGRSGGYNTSIPLWNVSLAKALLKNDRGELKLGVQDLLDKNSGITRSLNQGNIVDERYNVLQRYFMLSFTYSLNRSGLKSKGGPNIRIRTME